MSQDSDSNGPRPSGEAAWKAHRDAIERSNSEAKLRAREHVNAKTQAAAARERRLAAAESAQLQVLNERLRARRESSAD